MNIKYQHNQKMLIRLGDRLAVMLIILFTLTLASCHSSKKVAPSGGGKPTSGDVIIPHGDKRGEKVVKEAYTWIGTPYKYGGDKRGEGTDCSGMVMRVYEKAADIKLPRSSRDQADFCETVKSKDVKKGDLVFFATGKDPNRVSHVGIVVDDDSFIHASSSKGVVVSHLSSDYYRRRFIKFGRVPKE
ncbi:MAG: C40 family peptidase [Lepagella sp.]